MKMLKIKDKDWILEAATIFKKQTVTYKGTPIVLSEVSQKKPYILAQILSWGT